MKIRHILTIFLTSMMFLNGISSLLITAESKLIALTFDDGPNTYTTPQVLDLLEEYDAKASFFLIGDKINDESAQVVKRAYEMGCEINSHSRTHSDMAEMSAEEIQAEMAYVDEYVYSIIGEYPKFFRPPYLSVSQTMYDAIDIPFITGYSSSDSSSEITAEEVAENVLSAAKDGAIILMHDFYGNDKTVEALRTILPELQSQGYEMVTVSELFARNNETPVDEFCYSEVHKHPCQEYTISENLFTGSVTGDKDWAGWKEAILLDAQQLTDLEVPYTIEVQYESTRPPVIVLHRWRSAEDNFWEAVQPAYYNGKKACFLAEDLLAVLNTNGKTYMDMDWIMVRTYVTDMTITQVDLLVNNENTARIGDVNADGAFTVLDVIALQRWLLAAPDSTLSAWENGDLCADGILNGLDLCAMKRKLLGGNTE